MLFPTLAQTADSRFPIGEQQLGFGIESRARALPAQLTKPVLKHFGGFQLAARFDGTADQLGEHLDELSALLRGHVQYSANAASFGLLIQYLGSWCCT